MNLSEFINETLSEILTGVREAQKREGGDVIGAGVRGWHPQGQNLGGSILHATNGMFTVVDFDVSVTAETAAGGKAGIRVMSIGAQGGVERKSQEISRVKFAIHLKIPQGEAATPPRGFGAGGS